MAELRIGVLTCSDAAATGASDDLVGKAVIDLAESAEWLVVAYHLCPNDRESIAASLMEMADVEEADVVFTCGGIGLAPRDEAPEATTDVCERPIPGIAEKIRACSTATDGDPMLSRGVAAQRGRTIVVNLPGDERGAREALELVAPALERAVAAVRGEQAD